MIGVSIALALWTYLIRWLQKRDLKRAAIGPTHDAESKREVGSQLG
jgi:hypothetical protein